MDYHFEDEDAKHVSLDERLYNLLGQMRSLYLQDHDYVLEPEPNDAIQRWKPGCEFDLDTKELLEALLDRFADRPDAFGSDFDEEDFIEEEDDGLIHISGPMPYVTIKHGDDGVISVFTNVPSIVEYKNFPSVKWIPGATEDDTL